MSFRQKNRKEWIKEIKARHVHSLEGKLSSPNPQEQKSASRTLKQLEKKG